MQNAWRDRLDETEEKQFDQLTAISGSGTVNGPVTTKAAVKQAFLHCFERDSVVPERIVLEEALRMGVGTADVQEVAGSVIWIDEASLLGTRDLRKVVDLVERTGARLILSGDWKRQHGSVQRGGVLGLLDRYAGVTPIQIETIRRQQGAYKEAIASMASGNLQRGFDQLDRLGWVHELDDDVRDSKIARFGKGVRNQ